MAVEFDSISPSADGTTSFDGTDVTAQLTSWNHTASGSNTLLLVCVGVGSFAGTSDANSVAVTFGASSMTSLGKVHTNGSTIGFIQLFALAGAIGTNSVSITVTGTYHQSILAAALSFTGVDQVVPVATPSTKYSNTATPNFMGFITGGVNDMVFAVQGNAYGGKEDSCSGTERLNATISDCPTGCNSLACSTTPGGSASPTFQIGGASYWATIGVDIHTMYEGIPPPIVHSPVARYYG